MLVKDRNTLDMKSQIERNFIQCYCNNPLRPCVFYYSDQKACAAKAFWQDIPSISRNKTKLALSLTADTT